MIKSGISVVICSYNGKDRLKVTLDHIFAQKVDRAVPVEILFVDNRSTDGTFEFVESYLNGHKFFGEYRLMTEPRPGKAFAIEYAFDEAKYECIVICDDDNWLCDTFFQTAYNLMSQHQEIGIIGCSAKGEFEISPPPWFWNFASAYIVGNQADKEGVFPDKREFVWGAGMVFRKSIWTYLRQAGFQFCTGKNVNKAVGEDTELSMIVKQMGYKLYYSTGLSLKHWMPQERLKWNKCISMFKGFGSTAPYYTFYKYYFNSRKTEKRPVFLKEYMKRVILNIFSLVKLTIHSPGSLLFSDKERVGDAVVLKIAERKAYLNEIIFNYAHFRSKVRLIDVLVKKLKPIEFE